MAKFFLRHRLRGGFGLIEVAQWLGWLDCLVRYELGPHVSFQVPLYRRENQWSLPDVLSYEQALVARVVERLAAQPGPVRLIDCGADIGIIPALLASRTNHLAEVLAFEPNPAAFEVLEENLRLLPCAGHARRAAVSDVAGRGVLQSAQRGPTEHSKYLASAPDGDVIVVRLDDLSLPRDGTLAIKIDVEGGEFNVLRGAARTLADTPHWVVAFEAHQDVCDRTGIDPCKILRWLRTIRKTAHVVAERPDVMLDPALPFFEQVTRTPITNVVCWTVD